MIHIVSGTNSYMVIRAVRQLTRDFTEQYGDFGLERIDGEQIETGRLLETVASLPFLAPRRMVVVTGLSANKTAAERISDIIAATADTTDLVLLESKLDKRSLYYKTLKKLPGFSEYSEPDESGLVTWLTAEVAARGGRLSAADAAYLVQRTGLGQTGLSFELDKLLTHNALITRKIIDSLSEPAPQGSVFDLLAAAFGGDSARALRLYADLRSQRIEPQFILSMIAWQLHILAVVKYNARRSPSDIAARAKLSPYVVQKTLPIARALTTAQVRSLVARALDIDTHLKSEPINADDAVQYLLLTLK